MIKTVNLTTAVTAVDVTGKQNVTVKNIGSNTAHVSASPDISVGGDDCLSVKAGEIVTLEGVATLKKVGNQYGVHGTVYALASGATTIELIPTNSVNFKPAAVDFSGEISDISALIPAAASAGNQLTDKAYVDSSLSEKVDKADGMGLSSNDYTTAEKDKLAALTNYDDSTVNSAIADLQAGKADKSDTYTKTETDTKITEKVAEIVADAPEDFNTLKEMSDWISNHENDAAAMNSAIQTNTSNISNLQRNKVDKETGKSLVSDSEIARLSAVDNYDDTAVKADIQAIQGLIPSSASPSNQLADKAYVSAMQSGSPYVYMKQAEYEALTEYEPDRLYWVTYPLSNQHLVWCNGECVSSEGLQPYANSLTSASTVDTDFRYYAAIAYNPIGVQRQNQSWVSSFFSTNLKKIDIAKGVTTIGSGAFCNCSGLVDISIPDSVTTIGSSAFEKCHSLKSIVIPDSVTGTLSAFSNCTSLVDIKISKNVTKISGFGNCTSLKNIIIPANAGSDAFSDCTNLETAKFLQGVTTIGQEIFRSCTSLTSVIIPDSVTTIDACIFRNCTNEIHVYYTGTRTQWNAVNKNYWGSSLGTGGSIVMHYEYVEEETEVI